MAMLISSWPVPHKRRERGCMTPFEPKIPSFGQVQEDNTVRGFTTEDIRAKKVAHRSLCLHAGQRCAALSVLHTLSTRLKDRACHTNDIAESPLAPWMT